MPRRVPPLAALAAVLLLLAGCSDYGRARRPAWRTQAENACVAQNLIHPSAYIEPAREIDGPGICGLTHPFRVTALLDGQVRFDSTYTLDCPMIAALNDWLREVVEPEAEARFHARVVEIISMGSYACRGINGMAGARLSEHAFANALDIGGFRLSDGRVISIVRDWYRGDEASEAFLRAIDGGACSYFTTVLGPGYNIFHYNHIHMDLAMRGNTSTGPRRICHPRPDVPPPASAPDGLPEPPPLDEELDISQAGAANAQALALHGPGGSLDAAVPPMPESLHNEPAHPLPPPVPGTAYRTIAASHAAGSGDQASALPMPGSLYQPYEAQQRSSAYRSYASPQRASDQPAYAAASVPLPPARVGTYSASPQRGTLRDDGAFAPEGRPADWDLTSQNQR